MKVKELIKQLKENLFKHYSDFNKERLFIENEEDFISINNHIYLDSYITEKKILRLKAFIEKFLIKPNYKNKQIVITLKRK